MPSGRNVGIPAPVKGAEFETLRELVNIVNQLSVSLLEFNKQFGPLKDKVADLERRVAALETP